MTINVYNDGVNRILCQRACDIDTQKIVIISPFVASPLKFNQRPGWRWRLQPQNNKWVFFNTKFTLFIRSHNATQK